jgi:hypothetical protein
MVSLVFQFGDQPLPDTMQVTTVKPTSSVLMLGTSQMRDLQSLSDQTVQHKSVCIEEVFGSMHLMGFCKRSPDFLGPEWCTPNGGGILSELCITPFHHLVRVKPVGQEKWHDCRLLRVDLTANERTFLFSTSMFIFETLMRQRIPISQML